MTPQIHPVRHTGLRSILATCALAVPLLLAGVACGDSPDVFDATTGDAPIVTGNFSLAWTIVSGETVLPCRDVGAIALSITLIKRGSGSGSAESFPCTAGSGTSRAFAPGVYDFTIDLRASGSVSLLESVVRIGEFEIVANEESALPAQEFAVEPVGNFNFSIDSGASGGNCASEDADGGAIVGLALSLNDSTGACVPADFVIAAGSEAGGTYSSNCTIPPGPFPCIGSDQRVSVSSVSSGALSLEIEGLKDGPIDCYGKITNFDLPGANLNKELGTQLLNLTYSPECDPNFSFPDGGVGADAGAPDGGV